MDQKEALEKATRFSRLAKEVLEVEAAVLFGSHLTGSVDEYSDIDVGLFVEQLDGDKDYLSLLRDLYGLADRIDVHIEPHLFVRSEDPAGFAAEIEQKGIPIRP